MAIRYIDNTASGPGSVDDVNDAFPTFAAAQTGAGAGDIFRFRRSQTHNVTAVYNIPQAGMQFEQYTTQDYLDLTIPESAPIGIPVIYNNSGGAITALSFGSADPNGVVTDLKFDGGPDGWTANGAIFCLGENFLIDRCEIVNCVRTAILCSGVVGVIRNSRVSSNFATTAIAGIINIDNSGTSKSDRTYVYDNIITANILKTRTGENGDVSADIYGITLKGTTNYAVIFNNVIGDPAGTIDNAPVTGILLDTNASNNIIIGNKCYYCWNNGTYLGNGTGGGIRTRSTYTGHSNDIFGNYVSLCWAGIVVEVNIAGNQIGNERIVGNVVHHVNLNGIDVRGKRTAGTDNPIRCQYNTVIHQPGILDGDLGKTGHGIDIQQSDPGNDFVLTDNCVVNEYDAVAANVQAYSISSDFGTLTMDNNHYYVVNPGQNYGRLDSTDYTTLETYQAALGADAGTRTIQGIGGNTPEQTASDGDAYIDYITGEILSTLSPLFSQSGSKFWGNDPRPSTNGEPLPDTNIDRGGYQSRMSLGHTIRT